MTWRRASSAPLTPDQLRRLTVASPPACDVCLRMALSARSAPSRREAVIFDGDDTLWSTEQLYDDARSNARALVAARGLDGAEWEELERRIDVSNVAVFGYSPVRFPTSCRQAYEEACRRYGRAAEDVVALQIESAARAVFERTPPVVPCAVNVLSELRRRGVRLALLTKGDRFVQERRIERSGLRGLFDVIRIVTEKSPSVFGEVVESLGAQVGNTWMVGNSIRSDVLPALEAGLRAAWIKAHVWEHERSHDHLADQRMVSLASLQDVPPTVAP